MRKTKQVEAIEVPALDTVTRGYLAANQLDVFLHHSEAQVIATVQVPGSTAIRKLSWLVDGQRRAWLVNRLTGTLFDPQSGSAIGARPRLLEAPIDAPPLVEGKRLPAGIFSTAKA